MGDEPAPAPPSEPEALADWQRTARPFMTRTVVALAAFFFAATLGQLGYLTWQLAHPPTLAAEALLDQRACAAPPGAGAMQPAACASLQRSRAILLLESNVLERRYHQSNALLMFAVWSRYLGFVTGMILAIVGAAFILGKLAEPESHLGATAPGGWKAEIRSTSPGLILCFLGVVLIVASIVTLHSLHTRDAATYIMPINPADDGGPTVLPEIADEDGRAAAPPENAVDDGGPTLLPAQTETRNSSE
jgi:hypothetical protein